MITLDGERIIFNSLCDIFKNLFLSIEKPRLRHFSPFRELYEGIEDSQIEHEKTSMCRNFLIHVVKTNHGDYKYNIGIYEENRPNVFSQVAMLKECKKYAGEKFIERHTGFKQT